MSPPSQIDFVVDLFSTLDEDSTPNNDLSRPSGPCELVPGRSVPEPYAIQAGLNSDPPVSATQRNVDFSSDFCIAFTGGIEPGADPGLVFNIMTAPLSTESLGYLELSPMQITFVLGDEMATFSPPVGNAFPTVPNFVHLQICVGNGQAILYTGCANRQIENFDPPNDFAVGPLSTITFFQNSSTGADGRFTVCDTLTCVVV